MSHCGCIALGLTGLWDLQMHDLKLQRPPGVKPRAAAELSTAQGMR